MAVAVPKVEEAAAQITTRGGKTHTDVMSIPNVGRMQLMMDPQGAAFYLSSRHATSSRSTRRRS